MHSELLIENAMREIDGRLMLPNVTLVAVSSVALGPTIQALTLCQQQVAFGDALLLSDRLPPDGVPASIRWQRVDRIGSRADYSRFMLGELLQHIRTTHVLCVQWDGYILNSGEWDPAFLEFDYVGAPWPHFTDGMSVGNGGFSLRSRRLLEACAQLPLRADEAEDIAICRSHRGLLETHYDLRFAPEDLAVRFAYERTPPQGNEFGFHGFFNLADLLGTAELTRLIATLEPELLTWGEHREILAWLVRQGKFGPAWAMLKRMVRRTLFCAIAPRKTG